MTDRVFVISTERSIDLLRHIDRAQRRDISACLAIASFCFCTLRLEISHFIAFRFEMTGRVRLGQQRQVAVNPTLSLSRHIDRAQRRDISFLLTTGISYAHANSVLKRTRDFSSMKNWVRSDG